jgi:hypothetical protein
MSIEQNAEAYISLNYENMVNAHNIYSDKFPEDSSGDRVASPMNIGQLISTKLGDIKHSEGDITVPFDIVVEGDLKFGDGSEQTGAKITVSGELWGQENPKSEYAEDSDYLAENPNAFLYKAGELSTGLG